MTNIIILVGKSASGKDTLLKDLLKENAILKPIISNTTRPIRPSETQGIEYNFVSEEEFNTYQYIEKRKYNTLVENVPATWYYGTPTTAIELFKSNFYIGILDLKGLEKLKEYLQSIFSQQEEYRREVKLISIYLYVEDSERTLRAKKRKGFDETEWNRRLADDNIVFSQAREICDYGVENLDYQYTKNYCKKIIKNINEKETLNGL